jgi:2-polyprenyl-6-methoxyphenol hydroxylase-like FAD-dependent oxidoreductase
VKCDRPIVIVGAGVAGLLAALFIAKRQFRSEVILVESSGHAGGPFFGFELPGFGYCDRGMRILRETGIPEFDELLHSILPKEKWHLLPNALGGSYWRGELQTHSPYIDLRRLSETERQQCEREILECVRMKRSQAAAAQNGAEFLTARFGLTAGGYMIRVLEKLYRVPGSKLDQLATHHPVMDRVVLFDEERMRPLLVDENLHAVIAWPDQLTQPISEKPAQRGLYPRRFGMVGVIDAILKQLRQAGVRCLFNRKVISLEVSRKQVSVVRLDDGSTIEQPALLISANGLKGSLGMLRGTSAFVLPGPSPPCCWMVFLRTTARPDTGSVHYFWCFDEAYRTFRVTNYPNYCPDAKTVAGYPLCVEIWSEDKEPAQVIARAVRELRHMKVLAPDAVVSAQAAVQTPNLLALCTLQKVQQMRAMREEVQERSPENMVTVGPLIEDGVKLLHEVLQKMCELIGNRL